MTLEKVFDEAMESHEFLAENLIGLQNQTQVLFELRDELDEFNFENKLVISNLLSQVH